MRAPIVSRASAYKLLRASTTHTASGDINHRPPLPPPPAAVNAAATPIFSCVIPYYGYARQDRKMTARVPISAADVARLLEAMGVDRVVAVDLHCGQIQGFFGPRVPVDNLDAANVGVAYFASKGLTNPVVVSPDAGGVYRAKQFREGLNVANPSLDVGLAMIIKQRAKAGEIERMDLVGSVEGADVVIVDDMIDTAGTLCTAAGELKRKVRQSYASRSPRAAAAIFISLNNDPSAPPPFFFHAGRDPCVLLCEPRPAVRRGVGSHRA